jgi:prolyl 4-hydroxylase
MPPLSSSALKPFVTEGSEIVSLEIFSPAECASMLASLKDAEWRPSTMYTRGEVRVDPQVRRTTSIRLEESSSVNALVSRRLDVLVRPLIRRYWGIEVRSYESAYIVRYQRGDFVAMHTDEYGPQKRLLSLVCYLNEGFRGGATFWPRQKVRLRPKTGRAVLFPCWFTHPHAGEKVIAGTKYIIYVFLC